MGESAFDMIFSEPEEGKLPLYKVELFSGEPDPDQTFATRGGWNIEGNFLCIFDPMSGMKTSYRIDPTITSIHTTEVAEGGKTPEGFQGGHENTVDLENPEESVDANTDEQ